MRDVCLVAFTFFFKSVEAVTYHVHRRNIKDPLSISNLVISGLIMAENLLQQVLYDNNKFIKYRNWTFMIQNMRGVFKNNSMFH